MNPNSRILITGVSGYIGGRLRKRLEDQGYQLRCLVRSKSSIPLEHSSKTEYIIGDANDTKTLSRACNGVYAAYYLLHSMGKKGDFTKIDLRLAEQFAKAAGAANVKKIIYLGGLGNSYEGELSPHLKSRQEVGHILRAHSSGAQVIEFRASIVLGSGSLSFEMIRALVEKLPVMITPKWVAKEAQPIAIDDLLLYLVRALDCPIEGNPILEIGGADRVSYSGLMKEYARQKGLKRLIIPVPVLSPTLSGLWLTLITPLYARIGRQLVESAINSTVVHDPLAVHLFKMKPMGYQESIQKAILDENLPETRWNDSASSASIKRDWSHEQFGGRFTDIRRIEVPYQPSQAFEPIRKIGGDRGYYFLNSMWKLRGVVDWVLGGVGFRRGRRDSNELRPGDVVDFWRVAAYSPDRYLKLLAEMKVPGRAFLEYTVTPVQDGSIVVQRAIFDPVGIFGVSYWYLLYPIHRFIFRNMFKKIVKSMERPE